MNRSRRKSQKAAVPPVLLFVVNVDWFFLSHRLPLALAAKEAGFRVIVAAANSGVAGVIEKAGLEFRQIHLNRGTSNPLRDLRLIIELLTLFRKLRPQLIHHVTIKPVLYGSLVSRLFPRSSVINAISGLGFVFTETGRAQTLRRIIMPLYRLALRRPRSYVIVQNPHDVELLIAQNLITKQQAVLIRGSGVDCRKFAPSPQPRGAPIVMLASRLLWDKGVGEFVEAARQLGTVIPSARFVLVGDPDPGNPACIASETIAEWVKEGDVEWWGWREDVAAVLRQASIVVLPSYREGLPKVLLEAAATACPIVTTDVPGCREIVRHGVNGVLVPPRDSAELAKAIELLLHSPALREQYGSAGRDIAVSEFAVEIVVEQTMDVYRSLLGDRWPSLSKKEDE